MNAKFRYSAARYSAYSMHVQMCKCNRHTAITPLIGDVHGDSYATPDKGRGWVFESLTPQQSRHSHVTATSQSRHSHIAVMSQPPSSHRHHRAVTKNSPCH